MHVSTHPDIQGPGTAAWFDQGPALRMANRRKKRRGGRVRGSNERLFKHGTGYFQIAGVWKFRPHPGSLRGRPAMSKSPTAACLQAARASLSMPHTGWKLCKSAYRHKETPRRETRRSPVTIAAASRPQTWTSQPLRVERSACHRRFKTAAGEDAHGMPPQGILSSSRVVLHIFLCRSQRLLAPKRGPT